MDKKFKEIGYKNCYFLLLILESLLNKEVEYVEGFVLEVVWVIYGGNKKLEERLCVRFILEIIICIMYVKWLKLYRELLYFYN